jgi:hypothetical protein
VSSYLPGPAPCKDIAGGWLKQGEGWRKGVKIGEKEFSEACDCRLLAHLPMIKKHFSNETG